MNTVPRRRWLALIYGSLLVPIVGPVLLVLASSLLYYRWRTRLPNRARWINRHAWIAIALNAATNAAILLLVRP
jgi:hypothetical protein